MSESRLKLIKIVGVDNRRRSIGLYQCTCGNTKNLPCVKVTSEQTKSCGCLLRETAKMVNYKHGKSQTREYKIEANHKWRSKVPQTKEYSFLVFQLYEKQKYCTYCGSRENLTVDHIIPVSKNGGNNEENLTLACGSCNSSKNNRFFSVWYGCIGSTNIPKFRRDLRPLQDILKDLNVLSWDELIKLERDFAA